MYVVRSADITASLDTLANLPEGDPLRGRLKTDEVIMSGHSFGGYTTFASAGATFDMAKIEEICAEGCDDGTVAAFDAGVHDSRVVAAIPMAAGDSGMFGDSGYGSIACPLLLMTGSVDHPALNDEVWQGLSGNDAIRIDVEGGCHQLFGLGACDKISDEDGFAIVDEYALGFARYHLLGDASSSDLVDGVENVSEKVVFSQHTP
jgi:predicted dienelactone hydrolase